MSRRLALVAVAGALALLACAPTAAAAPGSLFGLVPGYDPSEADFARMKRAGAQIVNLPIDMRVVRPLELIYDWQYQDRFIARATEAGLKVLPTITAVASWVNENPSRPPLDTASDRQAWARWVRDVVDRYGRDGEFWALHPELPYSPIKIWQIWNEPNLPYFWGNRRANPREYARLVRISRAGIKDADPRGSLLLAGLFKWKTRASGSISAARFLKRFYRIPGIKGSFEGVAIHPFTFRPRGVIAELLKDRRIMNRNGDRRTPLWVDEFGWTTGGEGWSQVPWRANKRQQAKWLRGTYRRMKRNRGRLRLRRALWHTFRDTPPDANDSWVTHFGLRNRADRPKPAWFAFARIAGGRP